MILHHVVIKMFLRYFFRVSIIAMVMFWQLSFSITFFKDRIITEIALEKNRLIKIFLIFSATKRSWYIIRSCHDVIEIFRCNLLFL